MAALHPALDAAAAPQARVELNSAGNFAVLAGPAISSTSGGTINGNIGISPGSTFTPGTPPVTVNGNIHLADGVALQGQADLVTAYNDAAGRVLPTLIAGGALGGLTLAPGLYRDDGAPVSLGLTGTLTLDAAGDPDAVWIFQSGSTLIAEVNSRVVLTNGAQACNVFWQVASSATLRTDVVFAGNILALSAITLETLATLDGRALARNAAVTLDNNTIGVPCAPSVFSGVPTNLTVACDAIPPPAQVTAANACITVSAAPAMIETILPGVCDNIYTVQRVWSITNPCGELSSATQLISVVETAPPALFGVPANTSVECDAVPPPAQVTSVSACSTQIEAAVLSETILPGSCPNNYTVQRIWTANSACGSSSSATQLITVAETTPPSLLGVPANTSVACDAIPPPPQVLSISACSTQVEATALSETTLPGSCPNNYTLQRVWSASSACGLSSSATQLITVADTTAPLLLDVPANTNVTCDGLLPPPVVTATDLCSTSSVIVVMVQSVDAGATATDYIIRRVWTATDACGNSTSATQLLTVACELPNYLLTKSLVSPTTGASVTGTIFQFTILISNTSSVTLLPEAVWDVFDPTHLAFVTSAPDVTVSLPGLLIWSNLPPILAGSASTITVSFVSLLNAFPAVMSNTAISFVTTTNGVLLPPQTSMVPIRTTYTLLTSLYGLNAGGQAVVAWETDDEDGTASFLLSRRSSTGEWIPASSSIPAVGGGRYGIRDRGVAPGATAVYRVTEIESRGAQREHGPFTVTVPVASTSGLTLASDGTLVRPPAAEATPTPRARSLTALPSAAVGTNLATIKVWISSPGLFQLGVGQLATVFGRSAADISGRLAAGQLAVFNLGQPVPAICTTNGLSFYGTPAATIYSDRNVYWITIAAGRGLPSMDVAPAAPVADRGFWCDQAVERNLLARPDLFDDPSSDIWLWQGLSVNSITSKTLSISFDAPGAVVGSVATLNIHLKGGLASVDHEARFVLNDSAVGNATFTGLDTESVDLGATQLLATDNRLTITAAGDSRSMFLVDSLQVRYRRSLTAVSGTLTFVPDGHEAVTVGGFSRGDIEVFDITDPANPARLAGPVVNSSADGYSVSFVPAGDDRRYLATLATTRLAATQITAEIPSQLVAATNRADYLVITAGALRPAAQKLADYRKGRGLTTMVVEAQDVFDEFGYGILDPQAITRFLSYARSAWAKAPAYVVLVGDGSLDYRNELGLDECPVPAGMVRSGFGLQVSDLPFADLDGDGVLDIALGRLPVSTEAGVLNAIAKIKAFEMGGGLATKRVVALADNPDDGGAFATDCDQFVVAQLRDQNVARIYLGSAAAPSASAARAQLSTALNNGCGLLTYFGHSTRYRFAGEQLLTRDDVARLANATHPPIVAAMTCLSGDFGAPGLTGLGETLIGSPNGAVAMIASGSQVYTAQSRLFAQQLVSAIFVRRTARLGDAVMTALNARGVSARTFSLLGDPALELMAISITGNTMSAGSSLVNDFDGNGSSDIAVFWPGSGVWNVLKNLAQPSAPVQFGWSSTVPVAADYDGDGITDHAVYNPASSMWYIRHSSTGKMVTRNWGWNRAPAVPADYDGDGKADLAIYQPTTGMWYLSLSSNAATRTVQWGSAQAIPVPGDYDGDGRADVATYTPASGQWDILQSSNGQGRTLRWGWGQAMPVPSDYDGDKRTDVAVYAPAAGDWYILQSSDATSLHLNWGWSAAAPVPGDYDGDGKADLAVYAPATGAWHIRKSATGAGQALIWGNGPALPVTPQFHINRRYFPSP